jgi:hypothetical protein
MEKRQDEMFVESVTGRRDTDPHTPINAQLLKFTDGTSCVVVGLTKREYFAGLAMQGLLGVIDDGDTPSVVAKSAVMTADALIDELNK